MTNSLLFPSDLKFCEKSHETGIIIESAAFLVTPTFDICLIAHHYTIILLICCGNTPVKTIFSLSCACRNWFYNVF